MTPPRFGHLEVLAEVPARPAATPLLFVHGAFTGAWCWQEHYLPFFAAAGYAAYAVSLSGHGGSRSKMPLDSLAIADYVADLAQVAAELPAPPVLIGHSMGGFVVQKYLEEHTAPGAVLMCAVPPQGLMSAAFGMLFARPGLFIELNRLMGGGPITMRALESLREALFAQPVDNADLARYYRWAQPESHRALWDMSLFALPHPARVGRTPLLVLGAEHDHLIPPTSVEMTARSYGVAAEIFPGLGHGLMLERDWRGPAERVLAWLRADMQGASP